MGLFKDANLNPSIKDVFSEDEKGNKIYKIFSWSSGVIINDPEIQNKLVSIEGFKPFIVSYNPPIFIPIIVIALLINVVISFTKIIDIDVEKSMYGTTIILFIFSGFVLYARIYLILRKAKKNKGEIDKSVKIKVSGDNDNLK